MVKKFFKKIESNWLVEPGLSLSDLKEGDIVEVVMDRIPADLAPGGWDEFPKLDKNNCLILKRVV
jgi:hypothetical protein